ncbi:MAG: U32 family peptidase [Clostridia bacterium]|nr:U32 family peptidase [Clostridia bacterium]
MSKIEILSPCGDNEALLSAISAGAGAVYFGINAFNARIRARNFTLETVREAVMLCHAHGVKAYVTLNIEVYERELPQLISCVGELYEAGVDALIVADFGVATLIKERYPDFELHGSTQCSVHSLDGVKRLAEDLNMKRVVLARELDYESIKYISQGTDTETEIFVHGAHCMSVSGQCLMSYAMGGRSGNRGECAQPCRLPYAICGKTSYPLSLKDMSLSSHVDKIIDTGASSLKIEGRMKGKEYVYGVTKIWSDLVRSRRNADFKENQTLKALFSRQGFTDGYFTGRINSSMLGVRTDKDKDTTSYVNVVIPPLDRVKIKMNAYLVAGQRARLTLTMGKRQVSVYGDIVEKAINTPITEDEVKKNLAKLGATPLEAEEIKVEIEGEVMIRNSSINQLRRLGVEALLLPKRERSHSEYKPRKIASKWEKRRTCVFNRMEQIPSGYDYFDIRFIYVDRYEKSEAINGIYLPPVILDREWEQIYPLMKRARADGVKYCLVSNIGQVDKARELGFELIADYRFNVFNTLSAQYLESLGFKGIILSPELTLPQLRDFKGYGVIAYGKIPLMTTHKCVLKDTVGCDKCRGYIKDRQGASLYTEGIFGHRCVIHNSVPIYMADKQGDIKDYSCHFIFTDETRKECEGIIDAYKRERATALSFKRIK